MLAFTSRWRSAHSIPKQHIHAYLIVWISRPAYIDAVRLDLFHSIPYTHCLGPLLYPPRNHGLMRYNCLTDRDRYLGPVRKSWKNYGHPHISPFSHMIAHLICLSQFQFSAIPASRFILANHTSQFVLSRRIEGNLLKTSNHKEQALNNCSLEHLDMKMIVKEERKGFLSSLCFSSESEV